MKRAEVAAGLSISGTNRTMSARWGDIELSETRGTVFARFPIQSSRLTEEEISATVPLPEPTNVPPPTVSDIAPVPSAEGLKQNPLGRLFVAEGFPQVQRA
jgi:hypothetical protein